MRMQYSIGVIAAAVCAICVYSPLFLYLTLFVLYSLLLIAVAVFGTIYVHYKLTNRESVPYSYSYQDQNFPYDARSQLFADMPTSNTKAGETGDNDNNFSVAGSGPTNGNTKRAQLPIIFGRTVDGLLQQIIDNTMRDVVGPALDAVVANPRHIVELLREDIWLGIEKLHERAARIDAPKMIACDFALKATLHLQKTRQLSQDMQDVADGKQENVSQDQTFGASYLATTEKELEYLRKISDIIIIFLLPRGYSLSPIKDLLSEVVSYRVLYPVIRLLTSPDFINRQIVECIETKLVAVAIQKRSHEYAANFDDFLRIIEMTQTIEELHSIRASIVSDILQATTMQTMQRKRGGVGTSHDELGSEVNDRQKQDKQQHTYQCVSGAELTNSFKLEKYIQQLSFAKSHCEKCLTQLGWKGSISNDVELSILDILSTVAGRRQLTAFLEPMNAWALVGYYSSVEELKHAPRSAWHQLGTDIFYTYIRAPNSEIPLDKATRKRMEAFLVGDTSGLEVFYEVQRGCLAMLEERYYQPFLLSDQYACLKSTLTQDEFKEIITFCDTVSDGEPCTEIGSILPRGNENTNSLEGFSSSTVMASVSASVSSTIGGCGGLDLADLSNHSQYARNKLDQLDEKLGNKQQALEALKQSLKPDSRLLLMLEREIEWLKGERRQLESHLLRTEVWSEYLGRWRAIVESVDFSDDRESPQFMIVVQVDEMDDYGTEVGRDESLEANAFQPTDSISAGWVVVRSLAQCHELHRKLRPMCAELRQLDLPSNNAFKLFLLKNDRALLEKAKAQVQRYLTFILDDDHLHQSEVVYEFLSPSSDRMKLGCAGSIFAPGNSSSSKKSSKFSLNTIFRGNSDKLEQYWTGGSSLCSVLNDFTQHDTDQVSFYLEGTNDTSSSGSGLVSSFLSSTASSNGSVDNASVETRDSIAEPLYTLLGEIFDLGGVFRWLRKSLISFVQITYGQTINRQIRESITALFDESMLHAYASYVLRTFWPGGRFIQDTGVFWPPADELTDSDRKVVMNAARSLLQDNIPELLCSLIGAQNARQGALKLFEALQNPLHNKQLFYDLLETVMLELFPEIRQQTPTTARPNNLHNQSTPNSCTPSSPPTPSTPSRSFATTGNR